MGAFLKRFFAIIIPAVIVFTNNTAYPPDLGHTKDVSNWVDLIKAMRKGGAPAAITQLVTVGDSNPAEFFKKYGNCALIHLLVLKFYQDEVGQSPLLAQILLQLNTDDLIFLAHEAEAYIDPQLKLARNLARAACTPESASAPQSTEAPANLLAHTIHLWTHGETGEAINLLNNHFCKKLAVELQKKGLRAVVKAWYHQSEVFQRTALSQLHQSDIEILCRELEQYKPQAPVKLREEIETQQERFVILSQLQTMLNISDTQAHFQDDSVKLFASQTRLTQEFLLTNLSEDSLKKLHSYNHHREFLPRIDHILARKKMLRFKLADGCEMAITSQEFDALKSEFIIRTNLSHLSGFKDEKIELNNITSTTFKNLLQLLGQLNAHAAQRLVRQIKSEDLLELIFAADYLQIKPNKLLKQAQQRLCQLMANNPVVAKPLIGEYRIERFCPNVQWPLDSALALHQLKCIESFTFNPFTVVPIQRLTISYATDGRHVVISNRDQTRICSLGHDAYTSRRLPGNFFAEVKFSPTEAFITNGRYHDFRLLKTDTLSPVSTERVANIRKIIWANNDSVCALFNQNGFYLLNFSPSITTAFGANWHFAGFSPDGSTAYVHTDTMYRSMKDCWLQKTENLRAMALSPDGSLIALMKKSGTNSSTVLCYANTGEPIEGPEIPGNFVAFSPDGKRCIITNEQDATHTRIQLYSTINATPAVPPIISGYGTDHFEYQSLETELPKKNYCWFTLNSHLLVDGPADSPRAIFRTATGECIMRPNRGTACMGESIDHAMLVLKSNGETILVHADGHIITLPGHFAFLSEDAKMIIIRSVTSRSNFQLSAYNTSTGEPVWGPILGRLTIDQIRGHKNPTIGFAQVFDANNQEKGLLTTNCYRDFFMFTPRGGMHQLHRTSSGTPAGAPFRESFIGISQQGILAQVKGRRSLLHDINEPPVIPDQIIEGHVCSFSPNRSGMVTVEELPTEDGNKKALIRIYGQDPEIAYSMSVGEKLRLLCQAQEMATLGDQSTDFEDAAPPAKRRKTNPKDQ